MIYREHEIEIKNRKIFLRNAREEDAEQLLLYLKQTSAETPFLIRKPDEITLTIEQEKRFIKEKERSERDLILLAFEHEKHIGNCTISSFGTFSRYKHRCDIAIALYQEYCGLGIGRKMLELALLQAKEMGYEQAELEVVSSNKSAVRLYESLGFIKYGTLPDNMKYQDGTYVDCYWMMKKL